MSLPVLEGHAHVGGVYRVRLTAKRGDGTPIAIVGPITFRFEKPDATTRVDKTATLLTTGADGVAYYDTTSGDLDQAGEWKVQMKDGTGPWFADVTCFKVLGNLAAPAP